MATGGVGATSSTTTPSTGALTMKLLVESSPQRRRVVFAEAGKDTVDFLLSLLAVPAGAAVRLLGTESMPGSMGNLYSSAERLADGPYVVQPGAKDAVLCASMPSPAAAGPNSWLFRRSLEPPAALAPAPTTTKRFFNCSTGYSNCRGYVTEVRGARCPNCGNQMATEAKVVGSSTTSPPQQGQGEERAAAAAGFVQGGMATYMVADDLVISPASNVSSIALINACAVRDLGSLQERTVQIGYKEGVEILKASLQSKTVLTDVFLGKNSKPPTMNNGRGGTNASSSVSKGMRPQSLTWRV